jgi:2,3-bisphosphoglycerate-independent phosphoglycerate mutase
MGTRSGSSGKPGQDAGSVARSARERPRTPSGAADRHAPCVCLVVLDGWGLAEPGPGNAVSQADTPVFDELWRDFPHTTLTAWGRAVGLPEGQMGNSEVGHLNLGAGSVMRQDLVRIDDAIADGSLAENAVLAEALSAPRVHLLGLVSDGGVHSSLEHLKALIALARDRGVSEVIVHAFTDGRDTLPHGGAGYLAELEGTPGARVGSVIGRYWAMDRDRRWERTQRAYDMLVLGEAPHRAASGEQAVREAYARGETDEFIEPTLVGEPATIGPDDSVIAFNFRPDRMRQLTRALAEPGFGEGALTHDPGAAATSGGDGEDADQGEQLPGWRGRGAPALARYATLTQYEEGWSYPVVFAPERPATTLGVVLAQAGVAQLHVAETEKYPHVTYFFNGGQEQQLDGERRELVASPRDVPTYDHKPQMSAREAAAAFVAAWREDLPAFAIINFANADMVGHTGVIEAAVAAIETVDACLGEVVAAVRERDGVCVVTADHGNADHMLEPDGSPNTAHSLNPVPLIVTMHGMELDQQGGILADVAPTVLELLGIAQPQAMTGRTLLHGVGERSEAGSRAGGVDGGGERR